MQCDDSFYEHNESLRWGDVAQVPGHSVEERFEF